MQNERSEQEKPRDRNLKSVATIIG